MITTFFNLFISLLIVGIAALPFVLFATNYYSYGYLILQERSLILKTLFLTRKIYYDDIVFLKKSSPNGLVVFFRKPIFRLMSQIKIQRKTKGEVESLLAIFLQVYPSIRLTPCKTQPIKRTRILALLAVWVVLAAIGIGLKLLSKSSNSKDLLQTFQEVIFYRENLYTYIILSIFGIILPIFGVLIKNRKDRLTDD